jgi:hypothetical protein
MVDWLVLRVNPTKSDFSMKYEALAYWGAI